MGQSIQMGTRPCPLSFLLSWQKEREERESRRRRLSEEKRATRRRFKLKQLNASLCPVLEMGLWRDWRSEQFARNLRLDAATILNYYCRLLLTGPSNIYLQHGHDLGNKCTFKCQNQTCSRVSRSIQGAWFGESPLIQICSLISDVTVTLPLPN